MSIDTAAGVGRNLREYFEARPNSPLGHTIDRYLRTVQGSGHFRWMGVFEVMQDGGMTKIAFCKLAAKGSNVGRPNSPIPDSDYELELMRGLVGGNVQIIQRVYNEHVTIRGAAHYFREESAKTVGDRKLRELWQGELNETR